MIINDYNKAREILQSADYLSSRLCAFREKYDGDYPEEFQSVMDFLSEWPMYNDGVVHRELRRVVTEAIAAAPSRIETPTFLSGDLEQDISASMSDWCRTWHRNYMGLERDDHDLLVRLSELLGEFFFASEVSLWDPRSCLFVLSEVRRSFSARPFLAGGLLDLLSERGASTDLCIAVAADSVFPVAAAVRYLVRDFASMGEMASELSNGSRGLTSDAARRVIFHHPPFRCIGRRHLHPLGEPIRIDISKCHSAFLEENDTTRRPGLGLSFGAGRHACPGASVSLMVLEAAWEALKRRS